MVTVGGLIISPRLSAWEHLGARVPGQVVRHWQGGGSMQVKAQGELLPIICAKRTLAQALRGANAVFLVDNESARHSMIWASSPVACSRQLVALAAAADARAGGCTWNARVPTGANLADRPSRLRFEELAARGARRVEPGMPALGKLVEPDTKALLGGGG